MLSVLRCASLRRNCPASMKSLLIQSARNMTVQIRKPKPRTMDILRAKDNIPNNFTLVFNTSANNFLAFADYASTIMLVFIASFSVYTAFFVPNTEFLLVHEKSQLIILNQKYQIVIPLLISFCTLIAAKVLCYKFVKRIYFDGDSTYKAVFNGLLPFQTRYMTISYGSVRKAKPSEIFTWKHYQYITNNRTIYLAQNDFVTAADLYKFCPETQYSV